jgi:hypothetical protein
MKPVTTRVASRVRRRSVEFASDGRTVTANSPMIATTTSNSTSVIAARRLAE